MTLYSIIYDFYMTNLFTSNDLNFSTSVNNLSFNSWLGHTCTIISLILMIVALIMFIKWIFKVTSNTLLLK